MGSYVADDDGKLVFREGVLVEAVRNGYWIVLDELNLAPSEVLEALNRLLDDNRELLLPETGEVVRPHPLFMLLATQNPPGSYGGRKALSKAFRNRSVCSCRCTAFYGLQRPSTAFYGLLSPWRSQSRRA